ncbi:MAG TPA: F0F1 ATP synthase subunit delta [Gemmatimonadaceae bacterium]|nr:F0F1 ATP synthase subunit delta [Gemmatimonadaceae bacterium]
MRDTTIARNYAEALLALARKADDLEGWGHLIHAFAEAATNDDQLRHFLEAPQISAQQKNEVLGKAFADNMPRLMLRFVQKLVENRRQMLIPAIAVEYSNLVDEEQGRVHARVTMSRDASPDELKAIEKELSRAFGKIVVPHVTTNPAIIGGVVVRIGDTVLDGSVRRRLSALRQRIVTTRA